MTLASPTNNRATRNMDVIKVIIMIIIIIYYYTVNTIINRYYIIIVILIIEPLGSRSIFRITIKRYFNFHTIIIIITIIIGSISIGGKLSNVNIDFHTLINTVNNMFEWAAAQHSDYDSDRNTNNDKDTLKISISIYNKARNLPAGSNYDMLRALLKGMSAYLLHLYSNPSAKCLCTVIKLFSRAAEDLSCYESQIENSIKCAMTCTTLWTRIKDSSSVLMKQLTPHDLESMKMSVYHSYTQTAALLVDVKGTPGRLGSPRQALAGAMELVNQLPSGIKLNFVHTAIHIGKELVQKNLEEDALPIFNMTISIVDLLAASAISNINIMAQPDDENPNENYVKTSKYELFRIKIKVLLSMAYCCMTTKQCDKAMVHLKTAEQTIEKSSFDKRTLSEKEKAFIWATVDYAKFSVFAAEGNWAAAEAYLRNYMKQPTSYDTAIELISTFLKGNHKFTVEFFTQLLSTFPNEPFFTNTRICNLEMTVANISIHGEQSTSSDISQNKRAIDLCDAIITDHLNRTHPLNQETDLNGDKTDVAKNYKRVIKVLLGRVKWYYSSKEWIKLKEWADLYFKLHVGKELDDDTMNVTIYKVEALLSENALKSNEEALALSLKMVTTRTTNKSIISLFKALLFTRGAKDAVKHFIDIQNNREVDDNISALGRTENLSRIIECVLIVNESSKIVASKQCKLAKQLLLKEWLSQFCELQYWRHEGYANDNNRKVSYYLICKELLEIYLVDDEESNTEEQINVHIDKVENDASSHIESVNANVPPDQEEEVGKRSNEIDAEGDADFLEVVKTFKNILRCTKQNTTVSVSLSISLDECYSNIVIPLQQLCNLLSQLTDTDEMKILGLGDDLEWLADFSWNLGVLLSNKQVKDTTSSIGSKDTITEGTYLGIAADLLLISSQLYSHIDNDVKAISISNQVMGLILSCGSLMDMDVITVKNIINKKETNNLHESNEIDEAFSSDSMRLSSCFDKSDSSLASMKSSPTKRSDELLKTAESLEFAESLVRSLVGFADNSCIDNYKTIIFLYMISSYCRLQNDLKLQEFIKNREREFFNLSAQQLRTCATIAKKEYLFDSSRTFLNFAIQVCVRNEPRDYDLMGQVFVEVIESSPSRSHALENIQEFEQLTKSGAAFNIDEIESVARLSFNNGITLMELDQNDIAEKFISSALSLSNYASESFKSNLDNMQSSYTTVLQQKASAIEAKGRSNSKAGGMVDLMHDTSSYQMHYGDKEKEVALTLASLV